MVRPKGESIVTWLGAWPSSFLCLLGSSAESSYRDPSDLQPASAGTDSRVSIRQAPAPALALAVVWPGLLVSLSLRGHEYRDSLGGYSDKALGFLKCPPLMGLKGVSVGCLGSS